jgi:hypothetical protein
MKEILHKPILFNAKVKDNSLSYPNNYNLKSLINLIRVKLSIIIIIIITLTHLQLLEEEQK